MESLWVQVLVVYHVIGFIIGSILSGFLLMEEKPERIVPTMIVSTFFWPFIVFAILGMIIYDSLN